VSEDGTDDEVSKLQMRTTLAGIAAATNLTYLYLHSWSLSDELRWGSLADIGMCPRLAGLSRLEKLILSSPLVGSDPHDAGALTALAGLTHLDLSYSHCYC
jgi:hypothetical protein